MKQQMTLAQGVGEKRESFVRDLCARQSLPHEPTMSRLVAA